MSWWKKAIGGIGKAAKFAAPALGLIPGVGLPLAMGIGAAGGFMDKVDDADGPAKYDWGGAAKDAGLSAGATFGANKLKGLIQGVGGPGGGGQGGGGGFLGGAWDFLKGNPQLALGGINALQNAHQTSRNEGYQQKALDQSEADYARRKGLEDQILGRLGSGFNVPDLGNVYADPSNPFAQQSARPPVPGVGNGPMPPPQMGGGGFGPSGGDPLPPPPPPMIQPPPPMPPPPSGFVPSVGGPRNLPRMY